MTIALHHMFVLTDPGAPKASMICDIGLTEGACNDHPGQGTANRRFFFANTMLEFLFIRDAAEAENGPARQLRFHHRCLSQTASPIGVIVENLNLSDTEPFPGWDYFPDYFPCDLSFRVGANSDILEEPLVICMPKKLPATSAPLISKNPDWVLTHVTISTPVSKPSDTLQLLASCDNLSLKLNEPHGLELVFNGQLQDQEADMMPDLPLLIRW